MRFGEVVCRRGMRAKQSIVAMYEPLEERIGLAFAGLISKEDRL